MAKPRKPAAPRDESLDSLRAWWYENGKYFVASALIGLFAVGGWKVWDYNRQMTARDASGIYDGLIAEVENENHSESGRLFADLRDHYSGTPYPVLGALSMAKLEAVAGNLQEAAEHLRWAIEHADQEGLQSLARVRLMRVLLALGDAQGAAELMEKYSFPTGIEALATDANGDVMVALRERRAAIAAYRDALSKLPDEYGFLRMKLQSLGASPDDGDGSQAGAPRAPATRVPAPGSPDIVQ